MTDLVRVKGIRCQALSDWRYNDSRQCEIRQGETTGSVTVGQVRMAAVKTSQREAVCAAVPRETTPL